MKKGLIISGVVLIGVGVAGYFFLRKPLFRLKTAGIKDIGQTGNPKRFYEFSLGKKEHEIEFDKSTGGVKTFDFPLYKIEFHYADEEKDDKGYSKVRMVTINKLKNTIVEQTLDTSTKM